MAGGNEVNWGKERTGGNGRGLDKIGMTGGNEVNWGKREGWGETEEGREKGMTGENVVGIETGIAGGSEGRLCNVRYRTKQEWLVVTRENWWKQ